MRELESPFISATYRVVGTADCGGLGALTTPIEQVSPAATERRLEA